MSAILLARKGDPSLDPSTVTAMHRLRHAVFRDRLGWDVASVEGRERDRYDRLNPVYVLVRAEDGRVQGCWRLLPTTGPYMLRDVFPELLDGKPAPESPQVWEISRFAVSRDTHDIRRFGFSETPLEMMRASIRFAREHGIERCVAVTSVAVERLLKKLGVNIHRLGQPRRIGSVLSVACAIEVDAITEFALFGTLPEDTERRAA